jgi:hypothetical protein
MQGMSYATGLYSSWNLPDRMIQETSLSGYFYSKMAAKIDHYRPSGERLLDVGTQIST